MLQTKHQTAKSNAMLISDMDLAWYHAFAKLQTYNDHVTLTTDLLNPTHTHRFKGHFPVKPGFASCHWFASSNCFKRQPLGLTGTSFTGRMTFLMLNEWNIDSVLSMHKYYWRPTLYREERILILTNVQTVFTEKKTTGWGIRNTEQA